jgi:uncharacterized protein YbbC (DUF1343 family)
MIQLGIDVLIANDFAPIKGKRVGLYTNLSAVNSDLVPSYLIFAQAKATNLVALFAPEHGIMGAQLEGEKVSSTIEETSRVPVYSLYGENYRPMAESLAQIDVLVCDIQDIGVRYYTFLWTLSYIMEACAEHGVPIIVCDRPNPLGGDIVQGSPLDERFSSIVGRFNIPIRHGMTIGELAQMMNEVFLPKKAALTVIACQNYRRDMDFWAQGRQWVPPSPNLPHYINIQHYSGSCLIEGTKFSEGRGTAVPFELIGAPFLNGAVFADYMNMQGLAGVRFRPHAFRPTSSKFNGETCQGVMAHITNMHTYNPLQVWLSVLRELRIAYEEEFQWQPPYQEDSKHHFDLLIGNDTVRQQLDQGVSVADIMSEWLPSLEQFSRQRLAYLLYK